MSSAKNSCCNALQIGSFILRFTLGGTLGDQDLTVKIAAERENEFKSFRALSTIRYVMA